MRRRTKVLVRCGAALLLSAIACGAAVAAEGDGAAALPAYRVDTQGFGASEADIRAVIDSAARELWRFFPDYTLEPLVVTRGRGGPITLFKRNERGEIVVRLDTEKTFWSQYSYQFAHEFCHILCGFREGYRGNQWFEETLCETASLFVMRAMARTWATSPPFPNWRDYRDALRSYTDDIIRKRERACELFAKGLPAFYRDNQAALRKEPCSRELNGAMTIVFLQLFETQPERWEAVRWLNSSAAPEGETFAAYLTRWREAAPARHKAFIESIGALYGIAMSSGEASSPDGTR